MIGGFRTGQLFRPWWWRQKIHPSWIFMSWIMAIVFGLLFGLLDFADNFTDYVWWAISILGLVIGIIYSQRYILIVVLLCGFVLGVSRAGGEAQIYDKYSYFIDKNVNFSGFVLEDLDIDKKQNYVIRLGDVKIEGQQMPGKIWLVVEDDYKIKRGDEIFLTGTLNDGFGSFSASSYSSKVNEIIPHSKNNLALLIRDDFSQKISEVIKNPEAGLGLGFLVGQRRALDPELIEILKIAGLTHVIVASGYNVTLLTRFSKRVFSKFSRYLALLFAILLIIGFIFMTGFSPSMIRAGLVSGFLILLWYFGRKSHPLMILTLAAGITSFINPSYIWYDLGWQLSFLAFYGVMILSPLINAYFFGENRATTLRQILTETFSAQALTLPVILFTFGNFASYALIANLVVVPLIPVTMLLVLISGVMSYVNDFLASVVGFLAEQILGFMIYSAKYIANLEGSFFEIQISFWEMIVLYVLLILLSFYLRFASGLNIRNSNMVD